MDPVYALRIAFEHGLATREHVAAWVDAEVMRRDALPAELLELATLSGKTVAEIVKLLEALERPVAPKERGRARIGVIGELYRRGALDLRSAIGELFRMAVSQTGGDDDELTHEEIVEIYTLDDACDLALSRTHGNLDDVAKRFTVFVAR